MSILSLNFTTSIALDSCSPSEPRKLILKDMDNIRVVSVEAKNSIDFIQYVFALYHSETCFVINRTSNLKEVAPFINIVEEVSVGDNKGWFSANHKLNRSETPAQIVFTSGTEGKPKAIILSHNNLADVVCRLNQVMQVDSSIREYIGIPITYSFGLGRCRAVAVAGGSMYIPPAGFNPLEIKKLLTAGEINSVSAVPSLWRIILSSKDIFKDCGHLLQWVEIGSQYMSMAEKLAMKEVFPNAQIVQHYGLTEASRTTFLEITTLDGDALESVGSCHGNVETKISKAGKISIRGDNVALGKIEENGEIVPLVDEHGWLETNDLGEIKDGYLWFKGRSDDQINISGVKLSPESLETELIQIFGSSGNFALFAMHDELRGMKLGLAYLAGGGLCLSQILEYLTASLLKLGISGSNNIECYAVETIPRTDTGKVKRKEIAKIVHNLPETVNCTLKNEVNLTDEEQEVAQLWQRVLGNVDIRPNDRFLDIGGDSLSTLQIVIMMERAGFSGSSIQKMLHGATLSEVALCLNLAPNGVPSTDSSTLGQSVVQAQAFSWALNSVRGLMVCMVLLAHWGPGLWKRILGQYGDMVDSLLTPVYRLGTPGFAITFGIGLGYYYIRTKKQSDEPISRRVTYLAVLVTVSWLFLSLVSLVGSLINGKVLSGLLIGQSMYNVLCFYVLGVLSIPMWRWLINSLPGRNYALAMWLAFACWICNTLFIEVLISPVVQDSLLELPRLMLVARYGYFRMSFLVFLGCAVGCFLYSKPEKTHNCGMLGLFLIVGGVLLTLDYLTVGEVWRIITAPLSVSLVYFGIVLWALGTIYSYYLHDNSQDAKAALVLQCLVVMGVLALPIFAAHESVIPIKNVLLAFGVNAKLALLCPLLGCLLFLILIGHKLFKLYFSKLGA